MNKRLLSLLLACCFVFSLLPMSAMADEAQTTSGSCGENVTWALVDGILTISGTGAMDNYSWGETAPWHDMADAITSIEVGDGVMSVGDHAFRGLRYVESAALAYSVESISEYAFAECNRLYSIDMPAATDIGSYAFFNCFDLNSVSIPDGVATIRNSTFASCSNLRTVEIPGSTTTVEDCAFNVCDLLSDVYYSGTRAQWEEVAIGDCNIPLTSAVIHCSDDGDSYTGTCGENVTWALVDGILTISGTGAMDNYSWGDAPRYNKADEIISIEVLSGVTSIGGYAFADCYAAETATISDTVTSIGNGAFTSCWELSAINVAANNTAYCSVDGVVYDKDMTELVVYPIDRSENEYTIPDGVKSIAPAALEDCNRLYSITLPATPIKSINLPNGLTHVGPYSFENCLGLTSVVIPDSVKYLSDYAFNGCKSLKSVTVGKNVSEIEIGTFRSCTSLETVNLPDTLTAIWDSAFYGCSSLKSIKLPSSLS